MRTTPPLIRRFFRLCSAAFLLLNCTTQVASVAATDFATEVQPILSQHCFKCHGPDKQESGLRFDQRESAVKPADSDQIAIVPGKPEASELLHRVSSQDDDEVMPPRGSGNTPLTGTQIETLRKWISAGGRDHHKDAFSVWVAGGGFKQGFTYGETDEIGCRVVRDPVHVHDLQATLLHQLGIDHLKLTYKYQGRDFRLTDVHGRVVKELLV